MIIETNQVINRYKISAKTLFNKRKIIEEAGGIIKGDGGSSKNLYKTSVLDRLAREKKLGSQPYKVILNKDKEKADFFADEN